jgi:hypothetical protein
MANENKNTGPNTGGINDTTGAKENIKNQGDYNNILNESKNLLKKMVSSYDSIQGRIESLSKGSINLKQINQELLKAKQKDYIVSQKLEESQKQLVARGGDRLDGAKEYLRSLEQIASATGEEKDQLEDISKALLANLDLEQQSFVNLKLANDLNKDALKYGEDKLAQEKRINDSIGISGKLLGGFAKKLGLGNEIYESMVENAKDLEKIGAKLTFFDKVKYLGKAGLSSIGESLKDPLTLLPAIGTAFSAIGGAIGGLVSGLKSAFDYITGIQDKTVKFARAMNISTEEARKIKMEFASLSITSGDLFVNSQRMVASQMEMIDALGVTNRLTNEQLVTNIKLSDIPGLELESRKAILESSILTGKSAQGTTESILSQVGALKNATGISFQYQKILKEASTLGGYLGLSFAKYPEKLTKSLVTVKSMGLELKQLDSMANSFLDFESSISSEFEAQLLTGKNINLMKAREAFLNNDLATAAQEITKQVGTSEEFLQLNRISAEALAKSFGMSRDEMGNMLKQQELLSRLGAKDLKDAQAKVQALKAQGKTKEEIIRLTGEEAYQNLTNASLQEKIGAFTEKIQQSIADFVEKSGIIEKIESFFDYLSKPENIRKVIEGVRDFFAGAVEFIGKAAYYILEGLDYVAFGQIPNDFIESIKEGSANMGAQIRSLGGDLSAVTVSEKVAKGTVNNTSTPNNQMEPAIAPENRMRSGNTYIYMDPITGTAVVKVTDQSSGVNSDGSPIINPGKK